jgi:hemin uptake protein HemP
MNARAEPAGLTRGLPVASATPIPLHDAEALTAGGAQAQIHLNGQIYTLRITRAGKLILTK